MSETKGNGDEPASAETVTLLRAILDESKKTNARLSTIEDEFIGFRREVHEDFGQVHARLDGSRTSIVNELLGLRQEAGKDVVMLKERVEKLEAAVFPKPPRAARRAGARR